MIYHVHWEGTFNGDIIYCDYDQCLDENGRDTECMTFTNLEDAKEYLIEKWRDDVATLQDQIHRVRALRLDNLK